MVRRLNTQSEQTKTQGDLTHDISNSAGALLSYVERIERLTEEVEGLTDDRKEVYGEAKATGFDSATLRKVIARRKRDAGEVEESDALMELYEETLKKAEKAQKDKSVADGA
jgi:uncharacterized protein (UPF0335 family)